MQIPSLVYPYLIIDVNTMKIKYVIDTSVYCPEPCRGPSWKWHSEEIVRKPFHTFNKYLSHTFISNKVRM